MYKLEYCEWHGHMSADGDLYGGLVICEEKFSSFAKMFEYIHKYEWEWEPNPNWGNKSYRYEIIDSGQ